MTATLARRGRVAANRRRATGFDPTTVTGLKVWLRGDNALYQDSARTTSATADGDVVGSWSDASGLSNHVLQATSAKRPILKLGANGLGGQPVVRFDGVDDALKSALFGTALSQPNTVIVVVKKNDSAESYLIDGSTNARHLMYRKASLGFNIFAGTDLAGPTADSSWHMLVGLYNGASSNIRKDGGAGNSGNVGANTLDAVTVGSAGPTNANFSNADFAEILVYNAALSLTDINAIGSYLAGRYGLTWTTAT